MLRRFEVTFIGFAASALITGAPIAGAQAPVSIRPLGRILSTSTEPLGAVSQVRALSGGRVIVHDNAGRRVLMFDSTLTNVTVIADTNAATGSSAISSYSSRIGGLILYHGDSTLFVDPATYSMLVIDGNGRVVRTMAAPRAMDITNLIGGPFGTPAIDSRGRLVYRQVLRRPPDPTVMIAPPADSSSIVRFNFETRSLDTAARFAIPKIRTSRSTKEVNGQSVFTFTTVVNPLPLTDDWAVLADGTIAIVRGREYRVDFIDDGGGKRSGAKIPFEWERLGDSLKTWIIDSTRTAVQSFIREHGTGLPPLDFVSIDELPDYRPAFRQGAARGDSDGNLWVRTTQLSNGGPVYDVIDRSGVLIDRVQIPRGRAIAGFGPGGMVYMGVVDGNITRLERAKWR